MRPVRAAVAACVVALVLSVVAACTPEPGAGDGAEPARGLSGCDRLGSGDVRGRPPRYLARTLGTELTPVAVSDAVCAGLWVPRAAAGFVPQGVAVDGRTAWVSGYDRGRVGRRFCRVVRLDLRTGRLVDERTPVTGAVVGADPVSCRHGGGLALDDHGLWLTESERLWLLDPATLDVRRVWRLRDPVQGSFGVLDDGGRLGLGRYRSPDGSPAHPGPAALDWFPLDRVLAPATVELDAEDAVASRPLPQRAQGAAWATLGGRRGLWVASSTTRCGVLVGPGGARRAFLPGAEGMAALPGGRLWTVSESTAVPYAREGGRPVVAPLSLVDTRRFRRWPAPDCDPA